MTFRASFSTLVAADRTCGSAEDGAERSSSLSRVRLEQDQYPNVEYWGKDAWLLAINAGKGLTITTVSNLDENAVRPIWHFIQYPNGQTIEKAMLSRVTQVARGKFVDMAAKGSGKLPSCWNKIPGSARADFERDMERECPVLALCENSWKSNHVAQLLFPGFKQNNKALFETMVKAEPTTATISSPIPGKRKLAELQDDASNPELTSVPPAPSMSKGKAPASAFRYPNRS